MKIPKSFNVFGKKIKIKMGNLGPNFEGMFYPTQDLIVINKDIKKEEIDHTIIHEFIHSVISRCSLDHVVSYPSEEVLVDMITKALLENFKIDNIK
jgi:Zn-dependent peptidase ImmA (M78 family)